MTLPNKIADAKTPEWHALRKTGIGASEAAAACGLSPYRTQLDVYLDKTGQLEPVEETDAMRLGTLLEPVIQSEFLRRTGFNIAMSPMGLYRSEANPFMLATPDALLWPKNFYEGGHVKPALGEWKSTTFRRAAELGEQGSDDIPSDWVCQCQQQMHVVGLDYVYIAVLLDGRTLKTYTVEKNDRLIEVIVEAEDELWQRIENRDPPEPNWEHPRTPQLIREMYGIVEGADVVELSQESVECWNARRVIKAKIKELDASAESLKAEVLHEIGNASGGIIPGTGKMVRRKMVERKGYTVEPKSYLDVREVNAPKPIFERATT